MRSLLLIVVLAAMLATPAAAYETGYIGVFADETRSSWCLDATPYVGFEVYVFCLGGNGVRAAEFSFGELDNLLLSYSTTGPLVSISMGDPLVGISYGLYLCSTEWTLLSSNTFLLTADTPAAIWLDGHEDTGLMSIANCLPGYPIENAVAYTSVFVNYPPGSPECSGVATEETSWGAIKDMYNR